MSEQALTGTVELVGRKSSHFTRVARIFAYELDVPFHFVPVYDMTSNNPEVFAGNPAMKVPTLRTGQGILVGTENICRRLAELAPPGSKPGSNQGTRARIVWPSDLRGDLLRNAHELVWHSMSAQVQLVVGVMLAKLPAENPFFARGRKGFEGALTWLEQHIDQILAALPPRDLSLFEVALFCLVEHLSFRQTLPVAPYRVLLRFAAEFGKRPSARQTPFEFDVPTPTG